MSSARLGRPALRRPAAAGLHCCGAEGGGVGLQGELAHRAFEIANADDKAFSLTEHGRASGGTGAAVAHLKLGTARSNPGSPCGPTNRCPDRLGRHPTCANGRVAHRPCRSRSNSGYGRSRRQARAPAAAASPSVVETMGALDRDDSAGRGGAPARPPMRAALRSSAFVCPLLSSPADQAGSGAADGPPLTAVKAGAQLSPPHAGPHLVPTDPAIACAVYGAAGYRVLRPRAVQLDMLRTAGRRHRRPSATPKSACRLLRSRPTCSRCSAARSRK